MGLERKGKHEIERMKGEYGMTDMKGKTVFITGATSGIGKETARALARMGANIVFTTRDVERGKRTVEELRRTAGNPNIVSTHCDLASFDSVCKCAGRFLEDHDRLYALINNAGVWMKERKLSEDGIEMTFAVNYLAPFLLTNLFLNALIRGAPSRIVNVASGLHGESVRFDDPEFERSFSGRKAYSQSKLALILFTKLLAEKLRGTGVTANCVHPGLINTKLSRHSGLIMRGAFKLFGKDPKKGAKTPVHVASSPEIERRGITGEYFADEKIGRSSRESRDIEKAKRLWDMSVEYVGSDIPSPLFPDGTAGFEE